MKKIKNNFHFTKNERFLQISTNQTISDTFQKIWTFRTFSDNEKKFTLRKNSKCWKSIITTKKILLDFSTNQAILGFFEIFLYCEKNIFCTVKKIFFSLWKKLKSLRIVWFGEKLNKIFLVVIIDFWHLGFFQRWNFFSLSEKIRKIRIFWKLSEMVWFIEIWWNLSFFLVWKLFFIFFIIKHGVWKGGAPM